MNKSIPSLFDLFVPYSIALIAKEKGFDQPCFGAYNATEELKIFSEVSLAKSQADCEYICSGISAPIYEQLISWLLQSHQLLIQLRNDNPYTSTINLHRVRRFKNDDIQISQVNSIQTQFDVYDKTKLMNKALIDALNRI